MNLAIGEASKASGVSAKMIRYYESIGLIAAPRRSAAGYRFYDDRDIQTLRFIRRARDLGFAVEDIGRLLELARQHIAELQQRIDALQAMQRTLERLAQACHGDDRPDCPILDDLAVGKTEGPVAPRRAFAS